jgi:general secretion pathway protein D
MGWKLLISNIFRMLALFCAIILCGCTSGSFVQMKVPSMLDRLANADLSAPKPGPSVSPIEYASGQTSKGSTEIYPATMGDGLHKPNKPGLAKNSNGYELNFNNAELAELAKVILKDTLEVPYVFDARVRGQVTLSTGRPIPREELLFLLESVLQMNRATMVRDGDVYRILPSGEARATEIGSVDYPSESSEVGPGYGLSIFPLKYVSADAMLNMLRSFATDANALKATVTNNLLIVRGTGRERQILLEVAATFDVDWMKGQSAGIYVLKNASIKDVLPELKDVFQTENGLGKGVVRFQAVDRLNAILALTQKPEYLKQVSDWVGRLDRDSADGEGLYVYRVEHGKAKDLAGILNDTFGAGGGGGRSRGPEDKVAPDRGAFKSASLDSSGGGGLGSSGGGGLGSSSGSLSSSGGSGGSLSSGSGEGFGSSSSSSSSRSESTSTSSASSSALFGGAGAAGGASPNGVRIVADEINNKLLIKAPAREYHKILGVLRRIDQPPLQVLILATIAEVTLTDNLSYGVQFFFQRKNGDSGTLGFTNTPGSNNLSPSVPGLHYLLGSTATPKVVLDALATQTTVKVVSSPSIVVVHNQTATLQVGDEVPVATRSAQATTDPNAPVVNEIQFRNTGVILKVTPRVNTSGLVTMDIQQEISAVSTTSGVGAASLTPTISQRRIESTIAVQSGQMVVMGGLISEQTNNNKNRVPLLQDVPYLGEIVGNTEHDKQRTELIVFLRPVVIRNQQDAAQAAEALRAGMESMAPKPLPLTDIPVAHSMKN